MRTHTLGTLAAGLGLGALTAVSIALAGGVIYGDGDHMGSALALFGACAALVLIYDESPKRWALALYAALLVSSFIVLSSHLRGGVDGTLVFGAARDFEFHGTAHPGDVLRHEVVVESLKTDSAVMHGRTLVGDRLVATVGSMLAVARPDDALSGRPVNQP